MLHYKRSMKAVVMTGYGGNEVVELREVPKPAPGEYDVLIQIYAASVNPIDFKIRDGKLRALLKYRLPLIMGSDLAGVVVAAGAKVTRFKAGDKVYARVSKLRIGTFAEFIAVDQDDVALKPSNLNFEEAASLPLVALTVIQALVDVAKVQAGQKIFIPAGSGGVGTFAIQFAKTLGAEVATTTSTPNVTWVKTLGADHVIDYRTERFEHELDEYDVVLDTLGGESLDRSFQIVKPGGLVVSIAGPPNARFAQEFGLGLFFQILFGWLGRKMTQLSRATGVRYVFLFMKPSGTQLTEIGRLVEQGKIKPVIDRVFSLEQAKEALAYVEAGRSKGKVIISVVAKA